MNSRSLALLDVYPLVEWTPEFSNIIVSLYYNVNTWSPIVVKTPRDFAIFVANKIHNNKLERELHHILENSPEYKSWKNKMPWLQDVPYLDRFRIEYEDFSIHAKVSAEINQYGYYPSVGQYFFHGGIWPVNSNFLVTNRVLSTSLNPYIAEWHACKDVCNNTGKKEIWIIRVGNNINTKVYVYKYYGRQKFKNELEILFDRDARLSCLNRFRVGNYDLLEVEIN